MNARGWLVAVAAVAATGCGGGGKKNKAPLPVIVDPHSGSSHFPTNVIDFNGRASDPEDGVLASAALRWEVRNASNAVVFASPGASVSATLPNAGDYYVSLFAADLEGKEGSATTTIKVSNTIAELTAPTNYGFIGIAMPFNVDGLVETIAPATTIAMMTFIGTNRDTGAEVFRLPVAATVAVCNPGLTICNTTVTPSVPAGRYELRLEATTSVVTESAIDTLYVIADSPPVVAITSPVDGSRVPPATAVQFTGTAIDPGGDVLTISWTSSIAGPIGAQLSFPRSDLVLAKHTITLTATDVNGQSSSAAIDLYIEDPANPLFVSNTTAPVTDVRGLAQDADLMWAAANTVGGGPSGRLLSLSTSAIAVGTNIAATGTAETSSAIVLRFSGANLGKRLFSLLGSGVDVLTAGAAPALSNAQGGGFDPNVNALAENPDTGDVYFGTDGGIAIANVGLTGAIEVPTTNPVFALAVDAPGTTVWAGTDGSGLLRVTGLGGTPSITVIDSNTGLAGNVVYDVALGPDGRVWVGTDGGLSVYDPVANTVSSFNGGNLGGNVQAVAPGAGSIIWIGTDNGASRFDEANDRITDFDQTDLAGRDVSDIVIDASGDTWFACRAFGGGGGQTGGVTRYGGN